MSAGLSYADRLEILSIDDELLSYATPQELALYQRALEIEAKLAGILPYMHAATPAAKDWPHVKLLAEYLDALFEGRLYFDGPGPAPVPSETEFEEDEDGELYPVMVHPERGDPAVYNFAIHMPPRHGKSFLVSEHLPAYLLTKYPDLSGILASYEATFAESWGGKARDHICDLADEFGIMPEGGRQASRGSFKMKGHRGEFRCAGAGGSITGRGGHWLILDDPIANSEEARSEAIMKSHEDWWYSTFYSRRQTWPNKTPARVVAMFTRWTENDLRGRVIDKQPEKWCILNIPAIAEPTDDEPVDPLGREKGIPLCRSVMPLAELKSLRVATPLWFESLYQGRPYVAEGNLIKKPFQHYSVEVQHDGKEVYTLRFLDGKVLNIHEDQTMRFGALDLAASTKTTADWTVLGSFVVTKTNPRYLLVREIERTRIQTEDHAPFLTKHAKRMKLKYVLVEKQTYGTNLINHMQRQNRVQVRPVNADKDKVTRAAGTVVPTLAMRQLFFPEIGTAEWYPEFEKEILRFDNGTHDDQVDVLSYACQEFVNLPVSREKKEYAPGVEGRIQKRMDDLRRPKRRHHPEIGAW